MPVYSVEQFREWLQRAKRGDRCCYWLGHLSAAREGPPAWMPERAAWAYTRLADAVANAAYYAYRAGLVTLAQRRTKMFGYQYLAEKK